MDDAGARRSTSARVFIISVAAELAGVHPQTLRIYERKGLVQPKRTSGNTRRYSQADIDRLLRDPGADRGGRQPGGGQAHHASSAARSRRCGAQVAELQTQLAHRRAIAMPGRRSVEIVPLRAVFAAPWEAAAVTRLAGARVTLRPYRDDETTLLVTTWADATWFAPPGTGPRELADRVRERIRRSGSFTEGMVILAIEARRAARGRGAGPPADRTGSRRACSSSASSSSTSTDRGRGLGRRGLVAITEHLFDAEGAHRVQLSTDVDNAAMRRVAERLGFSFEGVLRVVHAANRTAHVTTRCTRSRRPISKDGSPTWT